MTVKKNPYNAIGHDRIFVTVTSPDIVSGHYRNRVAGTNPFNAIGCFRILVTVTNQYNAKGHCRILVADTRPYSAIRHFENLCDCDKCP